MLKPLIASAALATAAALAAPVAPALADHGAPSVRLEVGVHTVDHRRDRYRHRGPNINRREAVRIASRVGLARVRDLDFRNGVWLVRGRSHRGAAIRVEISARTGRVIDVDYGRGRRGYRDRRRESWAFGNDRRHGGWDRGRRH